MPLGGDSASGHPTGAEAGEAVGARRRWVLVGAIVVGVLVLDQVSKVWAVEELADGPRSIIGTDVQLELSRNSGSAFSLFQGFTPLLAILAIVIAVVLVRAVRRTEDTLTVIALALVLGGALGNLIDRIARSPGFFRGAVVDFVRVGSWPTFNVADSAITIGAILLVVALLLPQRGGDVAAS